MNILDRMNRMDKLDKVLDGFVAFYGGMKQRDPDWYKAMATTIGGSEISSLLALSEIEELRKYKNPYSNFNEVVKNKIAIVNGENNWKGGVACWWGTLFEEVITMIVEIELCGKIKGDSICIQKRKGHRNSPDGYIVAHFYEEDGIQKIYTRNIDAELITDSNIIMLEFKCPLSRKPTMEIPKHYIPQLWSGLEVSGIAKMALFVDSVFRKCAMAALGNNIIYDTNYHNKDQTLDIQLPVCWGVIALYSKIKPISFIDMGELGYSDFNYYMGRINEKSIMTSIGEPIFPDSNAIPIGVGDAIPIGVGDAIPIGIGGSNNVESIIEKLREDTPEDYYLLGVFPWKLFYSSYIPIQRREGFLDEIMPLINKVHDLVIENTKK